MAAGGWIGIAIPERYGGGGQGIREAATVLEEVAASGACMNGASAIHLSIFGMHPVVAARQRGDEAAVPAPGRRRRRCTSRSASPSPTPAPTPPRITTRAVRDGDHYVINGRKVWTSKALEADRILLLDPHHAARGVRQADRRA